ncbi:MAG TPA: beta-1,3-glucanase family protein, partial [Herpetosiphonaceae bacterium]
SNPTGPVCFYADINYGGASFCSGNGTYNSTPSGWNDRASSVRVQSGYTAELWADGNLSGTKITLTGDQPWLGNNNFNDLMSSYRVTQGGSDNGTFWGDTNNIPVANNVLTFKFLNRTNGRYPDSQVFWSFNGQTYSIAERPTFDMPANSAGRMYFYLGSPNSQYSDFIEFTVGPDVFNGNTTRVDWFGIKLAMRLRANDGYDMAVGEDYATFAEDRAVTFQKFINEVPAEFDHLAQIKAPYMIPAPGKMGDTAFLPGGSRANYFTSYAQSVGVNNASIFDIMACAGPLANNAQLCAALNRHVAHLPVAQQSNPANFYQTGPANYYAKFWHDHSLQKLAYGFPYDDYAEQSSFVSRQDPKWLLVAIGW